MHKERIITSIYFVLIFLPIFVLGGFFTGVAMSILAAMGTYEIVRLHSLKNNLNPVLNYVISGCSFLVSIAGFFLTYYDPFGSFDLIICILLLIFALMCSLAIVIPDLRVKDAFFYIGVIVYVALGFFFMGYIRCHEYFYFELLIGNYDLNVSGFVVFIYMLACSMFTDIFAYVVGRKFGKKKLAPVVSPNKSVEGFIGGVLISSVISTAFLTGAKILFNVKIGNAANNNFWFAFCIFFVSVGLAIVSQVGDLICSKLKREYEIKDYSNIFPGHGGVMDRFDSLLLTSVISFVLLFIIGVI